MGPLGRVAAIEAAVAAWPAVVTTSCHGVGIPDCVSQELAAATRVRERLAPATVPANPIDIPGFVPAPAG